MATELELRERQKMHLGALLKLKRVNTQKNQEVYGLNDLIETAIIGMEAEDVKVVEQICGVNVID